PTSNARTRGKGLLPISRTCTRPERHSGTITSSKGHSSRPTRTPSATNMRRLVRGHQVSAYWLLAPCCWVAPSISGRAVARRRQQRNLPLLEHRLLRDLYRSAEKPNQRHDE